MDHALLPPAPLQDAKSLVLGTTIDPSDHVYEQELQRDPYRVSSWLRYLAHKESNIITLNHAPRSHLELLYERAVHTLPGSYKLWKSYLDWTTSFRPTTSPWSAYLHARKTVAAYLRALVTLHKMPRIWTDMLEFVVKVIDKNPTFYDLRTVRSWFDDAIKALPATQHSRVWDIYLPWSELVGGQLSIYVHQRFLKLNTTHASEYINLLIEANEIDTAARFLYKTLCSSVTLEDPIKLAHLFDKLFTLLVSHPNALPTHDAEQVLNAGIRRLPTHSAKFHVARARIHLAHGHFDRARDTFEQAMRTVVSLRDFTHVFDAYVEVEEAATTACIKQLAKLSKLSPKNSHAVAKLQLDLDLRLARLERITDQRPVLVNDVLLRQNPNNTDEWIHRASALIPAVSTWEHALLTIHPKHASGSLAKVYQLYSEWLESDMGDVDGAREVFERAVVVEFKSVAELVTVWTLFAEFELRLGRVQSARDVMGRACSVPKNRSVAAAVDFKDPKVSAQRKLFKSLALWSFYVDLEESFGTRETVSACYDSILQLKIATPQIIINYALYLESLEYFEDAFKVYERGIALFPYPIAQDLWTIYLAKFIDRYSLNVHVDQLYRHMDDDQDQGDLKEAHIDEDKGMAMERLRDMFETALPDSPDGFRQQLFITYAAIELEHGLARRALRILDRGVHGPLALSPTKRRSLVHISVLVATTQFGILSTRSIYERAIAALPDRDASSTCLEYAGVELRLGEVDRARTIFAHGATFTVDGTDKYWHAWRAFELQYGNEETFKEMLRVKRSVAAVHNSDANYIRAVVASETAKRQKQAVESDPITAHFVASSSGAVGPKLPPVREEQPADVAMEDGGQVQREDDEEGENMDTDIAQQAVPVSVFGKLAAQLESVQGPK